MTTPKIADGAVTDAKISGVISTGKLNVGTASGTVAAGDHNHDGVYQKKYARIAVVAESGGDYTNPLEAIQHWWEWCATYPCLLKIMPGTYNVDSPVAIGDGTDIEGSGKSVTRIVSASGPAVVVDYGADMHNEVRDITLINSNTDNGTDISAVDSVGTLHLTNVDIKTAGANATAVRTFDLGYTVLNNVVIYTNGTGLSDIMQSDCGIGPVMELHDVKIRPTEWPNPGTIAAAVRDDNSCGSYHGIIIKDSEMGGGIIAGNGVQVRLVNTLISVWPTGQGLFKILNSYDGNYSPIANQ